MAGSGPSDVHFSTTPYQPFSATPVVGDPYDQRLRYSSCPRFDGTQFASSSEHSERPVLGSSNFFNVLKDRVQVLPDAHQSSSARLPCVGSVSQPTTTTDFPSHSQSSAHVPHGSPASPYPSPAPHQHPHQVSQLLQMLPLQTGNEPVAFDNGSESGLRSANLEDYHSIDWRPKEVFLKFRQHVEGYSLGANFEFDGFQTCDFNTKFVFKPAKVDRKWKFIFEPKYRDMRLFTKKIPIGPLLNIQVGIGHEWATHTTGWKWKVTSALGASGSTNIRHKTFLRLTPELDFRVGWNAEYVLPDLHGALGTGDPAIGLNLGHLYASVERLEAIYTHRT